MTTIEVFSDQERFVLAMDDFRINLHLSNKVLFLKYVSEPPFGDSYHQLSIDGGEYEGYVWGCNFVFPFGQNFLVCSYMRALYERKTIIINLLTKKNYILPKYYHSFEVKDNAIEFVNSNDTKQAAVEVKRLMFSEIENLTN
jgi:hypothetical protein